MLPGTRANQNSAAPSAVRCGVPVDMYIAAAILVALAAALFAGGYALARSGVKRLPEAVIVAVIALLVAFTIWGQDAPAWARVLPVSNVMMLSRVSLPLAGMLAGLFAGRLNVPRWRRGLIVVALSAAGIYSAVEPMRGSTPATRVEWRHGVCMQTSQATCGPAAAATLLATVGIESTEQELAVRSYTRQTGTSYLGIWRGLVLTTDGTPYRPEPITGTVADLRRETTPVMIWLVLEKSEVDDVDPRYVTDWGWQPGVAHSVVLLGFTDDDRPIIADPSTGLEKWTMEGLDVLYMGRGMKLVKREDAGE